MFLILFLAFHWLHTSKILAALVISVFIVFLALESGAMKQLVPDLPNKRVKTF